MKDQLAETEVTIIGGGIIGAAIARELSKYQVDVCLIEKKSSFGHGITKGSLGMLHSDLGLCSSKLVKWWAGSGDLKAYLSHPLRLKEKLNLAGHKMFMELAPQLNAKICECGRIMVAENDDDIKTLEIIKEVSELRDVTQLELLDRKALEKKEPAIGPKFIAGLYDPYEYTVFPSEWAAAFGENAMANGVHIFLDTDIIKIEEKKGHFIAQSNRGSIKTQYVINAAGMASDEIAQMIDKIDWSFILWKCEQVIIENRNALKHIVSEVIKPQKARIMLPTPEGNIQVGTIMSQSHDKHDLSNTKKALDSLFTIPQYYVPGISMKRDMIKYFAGYMHFNSKNPDDWLIEWPRKRFLNLIVCAPGIGPAPAIALEVVKMLGERGLELTEKVDFNPFRFKESRFIELPKDIKNEKIKKDPQNGHLICRCEKISEKEIRDALRDGASTLDEIKFRTWVGMGRCQGGFCTSRVIKIMSEELGVNPLEITQKGGDSHILKGTTKGFLKRA